MEIIDIYNNLGQKNGTIEEKSEAHRNALIHRGVCVWILNSKNELLLQKRNDHVMFPNMLDISFSGHIHSGETSVDAAIREGQEELGIKLDINKLQYLFSCRECGGIEGYYENEIDDVFLYQADIPIEDYVFSDHEVKDVLYLSIEELTKMVEDKSPLLLPYETHYQFLLTALKSRIISFHQQ